MPLDFLPSADSLRLIESYSSEIWTDKALVAAAKAGDFKAFEALVKRHQKRIYAVALGMLKSAEEAEEVTQDTFLSAFQALENFREDSAFFTWIYRVATNHCLMRLRKKKPEARGDLTELEDLAGRSEVQWARAPDKAVAQQEFSSAMDAALNRLDDDARAVLVLRAFDGLSMAEIGDLLALSVPAVKSRLHRARSAVKASMDEQLGAAA